MGEHDRNRRGRLNHDNKAACHSDHFLVMDAQWVSIVILVARPVPEISASLDLQLVKENFG